MCSLWTQGKLGYHSNLVVEAKGLARGLMMMWCDEIDLVVKWKDNRVICCEIKKVMGLKKWNLFGCYGTPYGGENERFWSNLETEILNCKGL